MISTRASGNGDRGGDMCRRNIDYYAEREFIHGISEPAETFGQSWQHGWRGGSALSLVVWTLKREVRAFGGCLGMHRR